MRMKFMLLGFSTECFYKEGVELKELLRVLKGEIVEVSALMSHKMPLLLELEKRGVKKFEKVSIHAPSTLKGREPELACLEMEAAEKLTLRA